MSHARVPVIAVLNSNDDIMNGLRELFELQGWLAVLGHVAHIKSGKLDVIDFLARYDPDVIVYDIAPPYQENWTFFQLLRNTRAAERRRFIVTTTNKTALVKSVGGDVGAIELLGKPFDLDEVVAQVTQAIGQTSPRDRDERAPH